MTADEIRAEAVAIDAAKRDGHSDWRNIAKRESALASACTKLLDELLAEGGFTSRVVFYWRDSENRRAIGE